MIQHASQLRPTGRPAGNCKASAQVTPSTSPPAGARLNSISAPGIEANRTSGTGPCSGSESACICQRRRRSTALRDVGPWLDKVQNRTNATTTLFLVDVCHSGAAARLSWQHAVRSAQTQAWVIAACRGDEAAYGDRCDPRFRILEREGLAFIGPSSTYRWTLWRRPSSGRLTGWYGADGNARAQQVIASLVGISDEFPTSRSSRTLGTGHDCTSVIIRKQRQVTTAGLASTRSWRRSAYHPVTQVRPPGRGHG